MHNKSGMKENNSTNLHGRERSHKVVNSGLQDFKTIRRTTLDGRIQDGLVAVPTSGPLTRATSVNRRGTWSEAGANQL